MAQRRMFSKQITDTDAFLDMPATAQNLYFHLNMHADDDGFLGNAKTIRRMIGASEDDLKVLVAKQFILVFPDGVTVIKDWHIHNYIQKDRYHPTVYEKDKSQLKLSNVKQYELQPPKKPVKLAIQDDVNKVDTSCIQNDNRMDTEVRLGKVRLGKSKDIYMEAEPPVHPPYKEIITYLNEKTGTRYKTTSKTNQRLIKARLNEGYTLDDFKEVIDKKVHEWGSDEKMCKFLRPATLFGTKFESYLNQKTIQDSKTPVSGGYDASGPDMSSADMDSLLKNVPF